MEQHAFGRVNAETAEQFRVFERQFDHLTNLLKLLADATDVLVGDAFGLANVFFCHGLVFDDNLGIGGNDDDAFGHGLNDGKG